MMPLNLPIFCRTNAEYDETFDVTENGEPYTEFPASFKMQWKTSPDAAAVLTLETTTVGNGIYIEDSSIRLVVDKSTLDAIYDDISPSQGVGETVYLQHDMLGIEIDGSTECWIEGVVELKKGITNG